MDPFVRTFTDPQFHAMCAIITWTAALYCLLALWAALSRRHWFLRGAVVLLALAALLPIRAHEPLILLAMVSAEIIAFVTLWRLWKEGRAPWRFGVLDLLLLTALAAGAVWIAIPCMQVGLLMLWRDALVASLLIALVALAGYAPQIEPIGWWKEMALATRKLLVIVPMMIGAAAVDTWLLGDWLYADNFLWLPRKNLPPLAFCILMVAYAEVSMWVLLVSGQTAELNTPARSALRKRAAGITLGAVAVVVGGVLGWLYWQMIDLTRFPPYPPMAENVYPQVVEQARLEPTWEADWLGKIFPLLNRPGRIEYDPAAAALDKDYFSRNMAAAHRARWSFERKAEQLHAFGRHDEAAHFELALIKLAGMEMNGGRSSDASGARYFAQRAGLLIRRHCREDSDETLAEAVSLLGKVEAEREPWQLAMRRENALNACHYRWRRSLILTVQFDLFGRALQETNWEEFEKSHLAIMGLLRIELAIERYRRAHSRLPASLAELVPQYLGELPSDAFSGRPFVYQPAGDEFVLYSVGRDAQDDGGTFDRGQYYSQPGYDLDLDTVRGP
jgi:hypothetical protein